MIIRLIRIIPFAKIFVETVNARIVLRKTLIGEGTSCTRIGRTRPSRSLERQQAVIGKPQHIAQGMVLKIRIVCKRVARIRPCFIGLDLLPQKAHAFVKSLFGYNVIYFACICGGLCTCRHTNSQH